MLTQKRDSIWSLFTYINATCMNVLRKWEQHYLADWHWIRLQKKNRLPTTGINTVKGPSGANVIVFTFIFSQVFPTLLSSRSTLILPISSINFQHHKITPACGPRKVVPTQEAIITTYQDCQVLGICCPRGVLGHARCCNLERHPAESTPGFSTISDPGSFPVWSHHSLPLLWLPAQLTHTVAPYHDV